VKSIVSAITAVVLVPVFFVVVFAGGGCSASALTPAGSVSQVAIDALPIDEVGPYRGEQLVNAAYIMNAAQAMGLPAKAQTIGVMTAIGESTLRVLDRGDAAGPDSRGLFQQRGNGAWGSYEDRMNPTISATNFFKKLQTVPAWESLEPTIAAHRVQVNADPYHYEKYWTSAVAIVSALSGVELATDLVTDAGTFCNIGATGDYPAGFRAPGPWGGFENGRVAESELTAIPWTGPGNYGGTHYLRADAVRSLIALNNAYRAEFGYDLPINDGYRDFAGQVAAKRRYGDGAATPGYSNHGWALAIDIGTQSHARIAFNSTTYAWLQSNGARYGWVTPEWAKQGGDGPDEAWHWEFWGVEQVA
jgi:hypothetical protein